MQNINLEGILSIVKEAARLFRCRNAAETITVKGRADFVTEVDRQVQQSICEQLAALYPDIQFMGEEKENSGIDFDRPVWILDPVDGTTNLIHDFPASCISLALSEHREVQMGIIYDPWRDELFSAVRGKGAFLNGQPIHVSLAGTLEDSIVSVGTTPYVRDMSDSVFRQIKEIFLHAQDIRRLGSAALDLAWVACGRTEAYYEQFLKPWDFAAGLLLVQEAGGCVSDYEGNAITPDRPQTLLASNKKVHAELLALLRE